MTVLWRNIRYGARTFLRSPGFAAVTAIGLALGIGANTAIFSILDAVLFRELPVPHRRPCAVFVSDVSGVREVTGNYYSGLGAAPLLGRLIASADSAGDQGWKETVSLSRTDDNPASRCNSHHGSRLSGLLRNTRDAGQHVIHVPRLQQPEQSGPTRPAQDASLPHWTNRCGLNRSPCARPPARRRLSPGLESGGRRGCRGR